jgi:predicted alpha/beta hydrolase
MPMPAERQKVWFMSSGTSCAAWYYPGHNGACVVMAGGFAVPKEPATDRFARRFQAAGFAVVAFDYRHIGESGGQPRQVLPVRDQRDD